MDDTETVTVCTHYTPADGNHQRGVYRVVGTGDPVALLRVADATADRVHTGELVRVERSSRERPRRGADTAGRPRGRRLGAVLVGATLPLSHPAANGRAGRMPVTHGRDRFN
ncbi:hypothetical protein BRD17_09885 [Halobacteriales archaeon SW_7_68_16]|nr:MAG: hypothetical protein BRD17_09885 [Halobacteriales archaeon SW_7_68_16]